MGNYEFYKTVNGAAFAAIRHNRTAPFSVYQSGILIGESHTTEGALTLMEEASNQVPGQMQLL